MHGARASLSQLKFFSACVTDRPMLQGYSSIIWDWNGTLMDDFWLCHEIGNQQLARHGMQPINKEEYRKRFRHPIRDFYADLGFDLQINCFEELSRQFHFDYEQRRAECRLHLHTTRVLAQLKLSGKRNHLLSAQHDLILHASLAHCGVAHLFEEVRGLPDTLAHSKVELGRDLLRHAAISPKDTVLVGDTLHDYEVATQLGLSCILVAQGYQARGLLEACGVPVVCDLAQLVTTQT